MKYYLTIAILLLILGSLAFIYRKKLMSFFSQSPKYEIVEVKDFSCQGMEGFTFEYPVFKGWEPSLDWQMTKENECVLYLSDSSLGAPKVAPEAAPQIKVSKDQPHVAMQENPHGVRYEKLGEDKYFFNLAGFSVAVELLGVNEKYGFSKDVFWKRVIESFRLTNDNEK